MLVIVGLVRIRVGVSHAGWCKVWVVRGRNVAEDKSVFQFARF